MVLHSFAVSVGPKKIKKNYNAEAKEEVKRLKIKFVLLLLFINDLREKQGSIMLLAFQFSMFLFVLPNLIRISFNVFILPKS